MTAYALVGVALFAMGCASPVRVVRPQPCPAGTAWPAPSPELLIPRPKYPFVPPMPVPSTVHGRRMVIHVVIDTSGRVMPDSITICGIEDPLYLQRVAEEISTMPFRPGLMRAKHVIAPTLLPFEF